MTVFTLKIIAIISMVLDHIKYAIPATKCFATEYLGRISFPIFAFLISEGFIHTHSRIKYMLRMLIFAIISQIPFYIFAHYIVHSKAILNVMFTFEIALIGLYIIEYFKRNINGIYIIFQYFIIFIVLSSILIISYYIHPDYGWYGVASVWVLYIFRKSKILTTLFFSILTVLYYMSGKLDFFYNKNYFYVISSLIPLVLFLFYNGKQGRKLKYFFYIFYPVHFIILYAINYFL